MSIFNRSKTGTHCVRTKTPHELIHRKHYFFPEPVAIASIRLKAFEGGGCGLHSCQSSCSAALQLWRLHRLLQGSISLQDLLSQPLLPLLLLLLLQLRLSSILHQTTKKNLCFMLTQRPYQV
jgi:hypothetical protein